MTSTVMRTHCQQQWPATTQRWGGSGYTACRVLHLANLPCFSLEALDYVGPNPVICLDLQTRFEESVKLSAPFFCPREWSGKKQPAGHTIICNLIGFVGPTFGKQGLLYDVGCVDWAAVTSSPSPPPPLPQVLHDLLKFPDPPTLSARLSTFSLARCTLMLEKGAQHFRPRWLSSPLLTLDFGYAATIP